MVLFGIVNTVRYIWLGLHSIGIYGSIIMEKKFECPRGIPEEICDHAPHCNVWKLREAAKKQA
jgi:hypothetical protein